MKKNSNCLNTVCALKNLHKKQLKLLNQLNLQHQSNSVSKVCGLKSKPTESNYKLSAIDSVNSVMQSVCVKLTLQLRCKTLASSTTSCNTLCTLSSKTQHKCLLNYAHRRLKWINSMQARLPSVFVPCLQIRVGRFDSGPRLHSNEPLFNHSGFSLCAQHGRTPTAASPVAS